MTIEILEDVENRKSYVLVKCTECAKDPELFGDATYVTSKYTLKDGILPCGCAKSPRWTEEQNKVRMTRVAINSGYKFCGWESYKKATTRVKFECSLHGVWSVGMNKIKRLITCPMCLRNTKNQHNLSNNKNWFLSESAKVHGDLYDYSDTIVGLRNEKVTILCRKHGYFEQVADKHINGQGCPKCCKTNKLDVNSFIEKSKMIHGDRYDYSKVIYKTSKSKVSIVCKLHGEYLQQATSHLAGFGCPECGGSRQLTTNELKERATDKHGNTYDYSLVVYKNFDNKISIVCKTHGVFKQTPRAHLKGSGCPSCAKYGFNPENEAVLYVLDVTGDIQFTGFGITNNIDTRLSRHKTNLNNKGCMINNLFTIEGDGYCILQIENSIKKRISVYNSGIEGFKREATKESFELIVNNVKMEMDKHGCSCRWGGSNTEGCDGNSHSPW